MTANISHWEDRPRGARSQANGSLRTEVCVVGLGGSGLACLNALTERGIPCLGIDAGPIAGAAAGRNGGFLLAGLARFHHQVCEQLGADAAARMYAASLEEIARMQAQTPQAIRVQGSIRLAESAEEAGDCELQFQSMRNHGLPVLRYDGFEGRGLLFTHDGSFHPLMRALELAEQLERAGVRLFEHSRVLAIEPGTVLTAQAQIHARQIVVAVDGALESVLPELAGRVRSARLQMLATAPVASRVASRPVYARFGYDYWQQRDDGSLLLGGCRDMGGADEWTLDSSPSLPVQVALSRRLARLAPQAQVTHRWAALVAYTDDGLPVCEQVRPGLWALGAYNGTGNVLGPMLAREISASIAGRATPLLDLIAHARLGADTDGWQRRKSLATPD
jgi:gamma-glutamylputrescine oxidase